VFSTSFFQTAACSASFGFAWHKKEHVAQFHNRVAIVLGELVGVEFRERPRQPALRPSRKRLLLLAPVERHELTEFVGALDHRLE
jgi:hypothetical protein